MVAGLLELRALDLRALRRLQARHPSFCITLKPRVE